MKTKLEILAAAALAARLPSKTESIKAKREEGKMTRSYQFPIILGLLAFFAGMFAVPTDAEAIPAFARKHKMVCSGCHMAWPLLNETGRKFKENGFRQSRKEKMKVVVSDYLKYDKQFPISAVLVSRPYDKKESGHEKLRAIHEVEIMGAGTLADDFSFFFEIEAEDETNFDPEIPAAFVSFNPKPWFNVMVSWGGMFSAEPYDTIGARRLTRGRNTVIDNRFGAADNAGRIRDARQTLQIHGRPHKKVYYSVGISGPAGDGEGQDPNLVHGRVAIDVLPQLTVGGFGMAGECERTAANCMRDRNYSRFGFDVQAQVLPNARISGAFVTANDDQESGMGGDHDNDAWFAEGIYVFQQGKRPWIVPLFRFDSYETNDGRDDFKTGVLNVTYYVKENVKVFLELFKEFDVPGGDQKDGRLTLQAAFAL
jgi:hypothetical protein